MVFTSRVCPAGGRGPASPARAAPNLVTLATLLALTGCAGQEPGPSPAPLLDVGTDAAAPVGPHRLAEALEAGRRVGHVVLEDETRPALLMRVPSQLSFSVEVPVNAILRFAFAGVALAAEGPPPEVRFTVSFQSEGEPEPIFEGRLKGRLGIWLDRSASLDQWAGTRGSLIFETAVAEPRTDRAVGMVGVWGNPVLASRSGEDERPDVILISVDCLRADHVGAYGHTRPTTPRLDRFAAGALLFESATSTAPWTIPSHYSMLTGLPPSFHGVTGHQNRFWGGRGRTLSPAVPYLPQLLAEAGYETSAVVSASPLAPAFGFHRGFAAYRELGPNAGAVVDAGLETLDRSPERNHFLFLHLSDPHAPYLPKVDFKEYSERFVEKLGPRPADISDAIGLVGGEGRPPRDRQESEDVELLYDAAVAYADHHIGRLLDELRDRGLYERSLIIVTADHGEAFYEHGWWQHSRTLYEEMIRVPLIVSWPGRSPSGRVEEPVSIVDVFPTVLAAAGVSAPPSEGADLRAFAREGSGTVERTSVAEVTLRAPGLMKTIVSLRRRGLKYIATMPGDFDEVTGKEFLTEELYDLAADPGEQRNLSDVRPADVEAYRRELAAFVQKSRGVRMARGVGEPVLLDAETQSQLRALGYVQ